MTGYCDMTGFCRKMSSLEGNKNRDRLLKKLVRVWMSRDGCVLVCGSVVCIYACVWVVYGWMYECR